MVLMNFRSILASWFSCCEGLRNSQEQKMDYLLIGFAVWVHLPLVVLSQVQKYLRIEVSFSRAFTETALLGFSHVNRLINFIVKKSFQFNYLFQQNCHMFWDNLNLPIQWSSFSYILGMLLGGGCCLHSCKPFEYQYLKLQQRVEMAKKEMTLVYYHVPQDKDDPECPNVFGVPYSKNNLKLSHIYQAFPLKGTYLFRFKYSAEGQVVWLDLPDIQAKLPTFKDKIYVKATRVSWNDSKLHSHYREKTHTLQVDTGNGGQQHVDFFQNNTPAPKKQEMRNPPNNQNNRMDLLKDKPQPAHKNHSNLLEQLHPPINGNLHTSNNTNTSLGMDFLGGMSSSVPPKKPQINLMHGFDKSNNGDLI